MNKIIYEAQLGNQQSIDKLIKLNQKLLTSAINYYPKSFENEEEVFLEKLGVNYNTPNSIFIRKEDLKLIVNNINELKFSQLETRILNLLSKEYEYSDIIKILNENPKKIYIFVVDLQKII
ncbi:MAG: hypothetical protein ACRCW6_01080 [Mycoplasmoidaceae bacterium]